MAAQKKVAPRKAPRKARQTSAPEKDHLLEACKKAGLSSEALVSVRGWLAELLVANEFAKLGQAGHAKSEVPLRRVFVDLPVTAGNDPGARAPFLSKLVGSEPVPLKDVCFIDRNREEQIVHGEDPDIPAEPVLHQRRRRSNRSFSTTLLIGGPGQGKSTLGQLACQIHRAALLRPYDSEVPIRAREVRDSFYMTGATMRSLANLPLPQQPLLPIHVALPELAVWLAANPTRGGDGNSSHDILAFVTSLPSAIKNQLSRSTLLELIIHIPALLVLDGFDEVGATADREGIVLAARSLLDILMRRGASAQILATTRPQGYAGELARIGVPLIHRQLATLELPEAMEYAQRLVEAKISGLDQQKKTIERLRDAAASPSTARLMTTPLQVTIITALVQQGRAPKERWRLFWSYFDYTYKREIERETYASALLAEHRAHIEAIHARVALLLQVEAEQAGGATARMSSEQLRTVVNAVLNEDSIDAYSNHELATDIIRIRSELVADILKAAGERLVFLVEPEPGRFGFEIRSLQEFMAAWALAQGPDALVRSRMLHIARASMFRNVLLFIASKLYSESSHLRELLPDIICGGLDSDQGLGRDAGAGALLALEILEEGAVLNQPRAAAALLARAVRLLDLPAGEHQVRLARIVADEWGTVLRTAIEERLSSNVSDARKQLPLGAWVCLLESLNCGRPWAQPLADSLPLDDHTMLELVRVSDDASLGFSEWFLTALEHLTVGPTNADTFLRHLIFGSLRRASTSTWPGWLANLLVIPDRLHAPIVRIRRQPQPEQEPTRRIRRQPQPEQEPISPAPPSWAPLIAVARFTKKPTPETLATALFEIARLMKRESWLAFTRASYWPLTACLHFADTSADLIRFAKALRTGELGSFDDWIAMESNWPENTLPGSPSKSDTGSVLPWSLTSNRRLPPLSAFHMWIWHHAVQRIKPLEAISAFDRCTSGGRAMWGEACLHLVHSSPTSAVDPKPWLEAVRGGIAYLVPRPRWMPLERWMSLLDEFQNEDPGWVATPPTDLMASCLEAQGHPVTLRLVLRSLRTYSRRPDTQELEARSIEVARQVIERARPMADDMRAYIALFRLIASEVKAGSEPDLIADVSRFAERDNLVWSWLVDALAMNRLPRPQLVSLLSQALSAIGRSVPAASRLVELMRNILRSETSELHLKRNWNHLGLPIPAPSSTASAMSGSVIPETSVMIGKLDLRDVRGIRGLQISFSSPNPGSGQWIVLLGRNGTGKTTILRSIAVACRNAQDPSIWPDDAFSLPWPHIGAEYAKITVTLAEGIVHESTIRSEGGMRVVQQPEHNRPRVFPLFGYGCRRGSALGGKSREVNLKDDGGPEVATLFSEGRDIIHAETWLLILDGDASRNLQMRPVYKTIIEALKSLLDIEDLVIADRRVWVTERGGRRILFEALSDGYLTTAGWFLDLIARWIELLTRNEIAVPPDFLLTARGLVLVDEIDLHIHPRWQCDVISRIRRLLPEMSFIVSTHNPLTLVGARPEEIWVLSANGDQVMARAGTEMPMLLTSGQILRQYFDITDIYPDSLGRALQRYGFLSSYSERSAAEEQEMSTLASELEAAGLLPQWEVTPVKRSRRASPRKHHR